MGRSYLFECPRCGYRAPVSGGPDRGFNLATQTIICLDCKKLYDVVTRLRIAAPAKAKRLGKLVRSKSATQAGSPDAPPTFDAALNRLLFGGARGRWRSFRARCPVALHHRIQLWSARDKCPRCATCMERTVTPYRVWD